LCGVGVALTFRKIDTGMWKDPWFERLSPKEKLSFIYFWSNDYCNSPGIYEISEKRICFDLGFEIANIWISLNEKIEWYPDKSVVWVKNFFKHQCQNGSFAINALNSIKGNLFKLEIFIPYNLKVFNRFDVNLNGYGVDTVLTRCRHELI